MTDLEPIERNEQIRDLSQRSMRVATSALVVVVLLLALTLALSIGVASSAQRSRDTETAQNLELQTTLECRSRLNSAFESAQGELLASISDALVLVSRGEELTEAATRLEGLSANLDAAADALINSVETCSEG